MKFCSQCANMYYIGISSEDSNKLLYYCRNCGNKDDMIVNNDLCVMKTELKDPGNKFHHIVNQYTKLDPTLPRIFSIKCPNSKCKTNAPEAKDPAEVIYMRYDDINLKYLYICSSCDMMWNTGDSKLANV